MGGTINFEKNKRPLNLQLICMYTKKIDLFLSKRLSFQASEFSPVSNKCTLCYKEKFYILFHPESADINSRDEIFSTCCHRKTKLLIPIERGRKKKSPGWSESQIMGLSCGLVFYLHQSLVICLSLKRAHLCLKLASSKIQMTQ